MRSAWLNLPPLLLACLGAAGCGHPASVAECEEIVERIAQLEYQEQKAASIEVKKGVAEIKAQVGESMMKDCVGKPITDSAMRCVRGAKSSEEIVEACFD